MLGWGQTRASDLVRHHLRGESEHRRSRLSEARVLSVTGTGRADRGRRRGRRLQRARGSCLTDVGADSGGWRGGRAPGVGTVGTEARPPLCPRKMERRM